MNGFKITNKMNSVFDKIKEIAKNSAFVHYIPKEILEEARRVEKKNHLKNLLENTHNKL